MPVVLKVETGWILPTGEKILLGNKYHSDIVALFLTGLLEVDPSLGRYCINQLKNYAKQFPALGTTDIIEDFAVFRLRWIKIGNNRGYNNNMTITIARYDFYAETIKRYQNQGYFVNVVTPPAGHTYEAIEAREYEKLNIQEVLSKGNLNLTLDN